MELESVKPVINVAAAVIYAGDMILIASRPANREYAGLWEFPGGKIEPGETVAQCLHRELYEELGITVNVFDQIYFTECDYPARIVRLHFVRCMMPQRSTAAMPRENQQIQWVRCNGDCCVEFLTADRAIAKFLGLTHQF